MVWNERECYTYPAIKSPDGVIRLVPEIDPDGFNGSRAVVFAAGVTIGAIALIGGVAVVWSCVAARKQAEELDEEMETTRE